MSERDIQPTLPQFEVSESAVEMQAMAEQSVLNRRRLVRYAGQALLGLAGGVLVAGGMLSHQTIEGHIGPHRAEIQPTFDRAVTIGLGPIGAVRLPLDTPVPIGVNIEPQETASSGSQLMNEYVDLFQHPDGEETYLKDAISSLVKKDLLLGVGTSELAVFMAASLYRRNKKNINVSKWHLVAGVGLGAMALVGVASGRVSPDETMIVPDAWTPITSSISEKDMALFPKEFQGIEIRGSELRAGIGAAWPFVKEKFITSKTFYEKMQQDFASKSWLIPAKEPNEVRIIVASDRHDNVAMDALLKTVIAKTNADIFIDGGDDTSSGDPAEAFSINSLVDATKKVKNRLAVLGNHDSIYTDQLLVKAGFKALNDKPVTIDGIRFLGADDPRHSDLGMKIKQSEQSIAAVGVKTAETACKDEQGIDVVVTHDPDAATETAIRGCAALTISGHIHRQVGPDLQSNPDGTAVYRFVNGTTGGARQAISLGPISAPADITMLSFKVVDGKKYFYRWQDYRFNTNASVTMMPVGYANLTVTRADIRKQNLQSEAPEVSSLVGIEQPQVLSTTVLQNIKKQGDAARESADILSLGTAKSRSIK